MWTPSVHLSLLTSPARPITSHRTSASARCKNGWSYYFSSGFTHPFFIFSSPQNLNTRERAHSSCPCHESRSSKYSAASPAPPTPPAHPQPPAHPANPPSGLRTAAPHPPLRRSRIAAAGRATLPPRKPGRLPNSNLCPRPEAAASRPLAPARDLR